MQSDALVCDYNRSAKVRLHVRDAPASSAHNVVGSSCRLFETVTHGTACGACGTDKKCVRFWSGNLRERDHRDNETIDGKYVSEIEWQSVDLTHLVHEMDQWRSVLVTATEGYGPSDLVSQTAFRFMGLGTDTLTPQMAVLWVVAPGSLVQVYRRHRCLLPPSSGR
jgi:hypothetical protein